MELSYNKNAGCPSGVPDDLYNLPHLTGKYKKVRVQVQVNCLVLWEQGHTRKLWTTTSGVTAT